MNSRILLAVALSVLLTACAPSRDDVASFVKTSLQKEFRDNPRYAKYGLQVQDLALVRSGEHEYKGIAKVIMDGQAFDVDVEAIVDGSDIMWRTGQAALAFLAGKHIEEALKPIERMPVEGEAQPAASDTATPLSPCLQARIDAFRKERGEESAVSKDMLDEWESQCDHEASVK